MSRIDELIAQYAPEGIQYKSLGDVLKIKNGKDHKHLGDGDIPVYGSGGIMRYADESSAEGPSVLIPRKGSLGNLFYVEGPFWVVDTIFRTEIDDSQLDPKFLFHLLLTMGLGEMNQAGGVPSQTQSVLNKLRIPVPPLEIQREIVRILDTFSKMEAELEAELEARKQQYEHFVNELLLSEHNRGSWTTLGDIGRIAMCKRVMKDQTSVEGDIPFYKIGTFGKTADAFISKELFNDFRSKYSFPKKGDVLISAAGTIGRSVPYDGFPAYFQDSNIVWLEHDESVVLNGYLKYWYKVIKWATDGGTIKRLYNVNIRKAQIKIPPINEQHRVIGILDKFDTLVNDLSVGLPAELAARRQQYEYYRDKLLAFKQLEPSS